MAVRVASLSLAFAAVSLAGIGAALGQPKSEMLGSFIVQSETDRFSNKPTVVALALARGGALGLKCADGELSMFLMDPKGDHDFEKGEVYEIKQRIDQSPVEDVKGLSLDGKMVQMLLTPDLLTQLSSAKEVAFRVDMGVKRADFLIALKQPQQAVNRLKKACGVN